MRPISCALFLFLLASSLTGQPPGARAHSEVEGDVVNSVSGVPVAGARVKLAIPRSADALYSKTDAQGHFRIPDVPGGYYQLDAEAVGCSRSSTMTSVPARKPLHVTLIPYSVIGGRLTDPNGKPFPYTYIRILALRPTLGGRAGSSGTFPAADEKHEWALRATAWPDDRGEFSSVLEPGSYYLLAGNMADPGTWDRTYRPTFYPGVEQFSAAKAIEVAPGQHVRADIAILQSTGVRLTGRIVHPPLPPAEAGQSFQTYVSLRSEHDLTRNSTNATTAGDRYAFENVSPGKYLLTAIVASLHEGPFGNSGTLFAVKREVDVGARDTDLALELGALQEIEGSVAFDAGCAPAPLRIGTVNYSAGEGPDIETAPDGRFRLPAGPPGRVMLRIIPTTSSQGPLRLTSVRMGDREVPVDGFEYPPVAPAALRLTVSCPDTRRLP